MPVIVAIVPVIVAIVPVIVAVLPLIDLFRCIYVPSILTCKFYGLLFDQVGLIEKLILCLHLKI